MSNSIFGGNGVYKTPDKQTFKSEQDAEEYCRKERLRLSETIVGRPITDGEWRNQKIPAAIDTRTDAQKMPFKVKLSSELTPLQAAIAKAEAEVEAKRDPYKGMTREEARLYDLKMIQQRESEAEASKKALAVHLKSVAPKLQAIDELIVKEKWSTDSDEAFRQQLEQARATLLEPNHDPADLQDRLQKIDSVLLERKTLKTAELLQRKAALEATLAQVDSEVGLLSEPDKPKEEFIPDPYGYEPPKASDSQPDAIIVKVPVNRDQKTIGIAFDLYQAMEAAGFGDSEISEVRQAAITGDESAMQSVIDRYAE